MADSSITSDWTGSQSEIPYSKLLIRHVLE